MRVLIVEDDGEKFSKVCAEVVQKAGPNTQIKHAVTAADAVRAMEIEKFDLLLLDVNIPRRVGEGSQRGGGFLVIKEMRENENVLKPRYIVGVTAFDDVVSEFGEAFQDQLWSLVHYREGTDRWIAQLGSKIEYIKLAETSDQFSDGLTYGIDLAIVCALSHVELEAVLRLPCDWQPLRLRYDETRYSIGRIKANSGERRVIAAAAPRMGLSAAAVLSTKMIQQFRPRVIAMVGICAGRKGKVNIGDLIVASPTWDWGSGKFDGHTQEPRFLPSPHQIPIDNDLLESLRDASEDPALRSLVKASYPGNKPTDELRVHFGALVSGAAVVAHKPTFDQLLSHNRDVLGIDMEAYGVASAALGAGRPRPKCLVLKGVSDYADSEKADDYQAYAAHSSAEFLLRAARSFL